MKTPVAVLLSGGIDSTTALAVANRDEDPQLAVSVDYGQRHVKELEAAKQVAEFYGVKHVILDMTGWGTLLSGSLTDPDVEVPSGNYDEDNMSVTVVPNRNATMLMAASGIADSFGLKEVWTAVHAGDHTIYPDCRPEFIESASNTAFLGTGGSVSIKAPFGKVSKTEIVRIGGEIGAPLGLTWSCYRGLEVHCGECGTCRERKEAFNDSGVNDPTEYMNVSA